MLLPWLYSAVPICFRFRDNENCCVAGATDFMEVTTDQLKQILDELFAQLESIEASNFALLSFFRAKGIGEEKELAKFFDEAANASSVKWRAARVRMEYLLTPIKTEKLPEQKPAGIGAAIQEQKETKSTEPEAKPEAKEAEHSDEAEERDDSGAPSNTSEKTAEQKSKTA